MAGQLDKRRTRMRDMAALTCSKRAKKRTRVCMCTQNTRTIIMRKTTYSNSRARAASLFTAREKVQISGESTQMTAQVQL